MPIPIIAHERIATWTGKLRPRFAADRRVRWADSRSSGDLVAAAGGCEPAIVLIDLAARTLWGMESLEALSRTHHDALILVLDPDSVPEVPVLARELGATLVWSGVAIPPRIETLLRGWVDLIDSSRPVGDLTLRGRSAVR